MKKYLIIASAALVALTACNKEVEFQEPANNTDEVVLTFTSERPQFVWHSQHPAKLPDNLWGWYCGGSVPVC